MADVVIRGGLVVSATGARITDVAVEDGRFCAVGPELPGAELEINAHGLAVLPGLIDVHLHFNEPGRTHWEGISTGSSALAAGGGTLFFDMPLNSTPCTLDGASFELKHQAMDRSSITDFALWGGLTPNNLESLDELAECGVIGFKAFMCDSGLPEFARADELTLQRGMLVAARWGLPVAVHAESEEMTKALTARIRSSGGKGVRDYLESRPVLAELEAIERAASIAKDTGARLHIVHVSSGRGVALAVQLRASGVDLTIETCPHYLFFTEQDLEEIGAAAKCSPPLRSAEEREALWDAVLGDGVDIIASDHSPAPPELKTDADFFKLWGGIAGVQSTLGVLLEGSHRRRLSLSRITQLTAAAPARRFHILNKGAIEIGLDADCTLVELDTPYTVSADELMYRHKSSPYLGKQLRGIVRRTFLRGRTIYRDGLIQASRMGQLVRPAGGE